MEGVFDPGRFSRMTAEEKDVVKAEVNMAVGILLTAIQARDPRVPESEVLRAVREMIAERSIPASAPANLAAHSRQERTTVLAFLDETIKQGERAGMLDRCLGVLNTRLMNMMER